MTQEERWMTKYNEVKTFIETNRRNLSKYDLEERRLYTWMKHNRKRFLQENHRKPSRYVAEENKHVNQYV